MENARSQRLRRYSLNPLFSHIYVEAGAKFYPLTESVLKRFPKAQIVPIENYKSVFNRRRQNWAAQKSSPKLILAVKAAPLIHAATDLIGNSDGKEIYYCAQLLNCIYDCQYCYLQGLYQSANMVLFVNSADFHSAARVKLLEHPYRLAISYDSDLLALEGLFPLCKEWIEICAAEPNLELEIRTKSVNIAALNAISPSPNVILAWTLSPDLIAKRFETGAPSLAARLEAIRKVQTQGWRIKLCFDPILWVENWSEIYTPFFEEVRSELSNVKIDSVNVGSFRMNPEHLRTLREIRPGAEFIRHLAPGTEVRYQDSIRNEMESLVQRFQESIAT